MKEKQQIPLFHKLEQSNVGHLAWKTTETINWSNSWFQLNNQLNQLIIVAPSNTLVYNLIPAELMTLPSAPAVFNIKCEISKWQRVSDKPCKKT